MNIVYDFLRITLLPLLALVLAQPLHAELSDSAPYAKPSTPSEIIASNETDKESPLVFESLKQMDELVQLGMPALAVSLLDRQQQLWPIYSPDWYLFARKRIVYLTAMEDWQGILDSSNELLEKANADQQITVEISQWFISQQVIAQLRLGEAKQALVQLRGLLWSAKKNTDSSLIALWRRLVVRSYLQLNADNDAQKAVRRYQYDYGDDASMLNEDWRILQARSLLRINKPAQAMALLKDIETPVAHALRLLSAIRAQPEQAGQYAKEASQQLAGKTVEKDVSWVYQYVVYEAALQKQDLVTAARVLQELLSQDNAQQSFGDEFIADGDKLWDLYEKIGKSTANRLKLLRGDDRTWFKAARIMAETSQIEALGLYAVLGLSAQDDQQRVIAHQAIVDLLASDDTGLTLVNQLYLHGKRVGRTERLPLKVRYRLLDYALSKGNMSLAAQLMQSLQQPPDGADLFAWRMRKARVLVLEGDYEAGEKVLADTVADFKAKAINDSSPKKLLPEQIDRYLQVVFDLQAVLRHQQAIDILNALPESWLNEKLQREIFFWKAESCAALKQHDRAAWFYLKSATIADATESPLWAQSARFKAAGALTDAKLYDDAATLYQLLLRQTVAEARKALIKQELQHLRLLKNASKTQSRKQAGDEVKGSRL